MEPIKVQTRFIPSYKKKKTTFIVIRIFLFPLSLHVQTYGLKREDKKILIFGYWPKFQFFFSYH
jgi:hypothetical protein